MAELKAAPLFGSVRLQRLARGYYGADTCLPRSIRIRRRVVAAVAFSALSPFSELPAATPRRCTCIHGSTAFRADEGLVDGWRMHRGGGSAGGAAGGGIVGGAGGSHRALELEHPSAMPGAPGFHWGAMLAGHHAAAAAGMMQPPMSAGGEYVPAAAHHGPAHPAMPMDLHVHQGFPYYRNAGKERLQHHRDDNVVKTLVKHLTPSGIDMSE
ncbi:hypothetical protein DMN91_007672 [Ooceraea biroi]|uniref:Uncharacterized protein n=1 Tax=Ooceraea biroi TaxID=2015173 RepID=A0A3L8DL63_OOCBI|nr:hypothetical protein DMN91_007672 [Ooceraea biroi]